MEQKLKDLKTDKYRTVLKPLEGEEKALLKESIQQEGIKEAITVDKDLNVVDGNNRITIARELELDGDTLIKCELLPEGTDVEMFIIKKQLGRRNLTDEQKRDLIGKLYNRTKKTQGGDRKSKGQGGTLKGDTAEQIAKEYGVSARTVKRAGKFAAEVEQMPQEERQEVLSGKKKVKPKADKPGHVEPQQQTDSNDIEALKAEIERLKNEELDHMQYQIDLSEGKVKRLKDELAILNKGKAGIIGSQVICDSIDAYMKLYSEKPFARANVNMYRAEEFLTPIVKNFMEGQIEAFSDWKGKSKEELERHAMFLMYVRLEAALEKAGYGHLLPKEEEGA